MCIIHLKKLDGNLHKGDFYINTSYAVPGHLIVKYHDAGSVRSIPLQPEDFPVMWRKDWTNKIRTEMQGRFLFLNCVINTKRGLERRPWRYLMSETGNVSVKQFKGEWTTVSYNSCGKQIDCFLLRVKIIVSFKIQFDIFSLWIESSSKKYNYKTMWDHFICDPTLCVLLSSMSPMVFGMGMVWIIPNTITVLSLTFLFVGMLHCYMCGYTRFL